MSYLSDGLVRSLLNAQRMVVLTGAGTSAESGIATFRQAQTGLWAHFSPQELATPEAFERHPQRVWDWYQWRREQVLAAVPHAGHRALAALQDRFSTFTLVTQNVDGLHQRAGSRGVIELHGSILGNICHRTRLAVAVEAIAMAKERPPRSPHHPAGLVRPAVVWFGEALDAAVLARASAAAAACDVLLSVGTSSVVEPAASLPYLVKKHGGQVIEINPQPTPLTAHADYVVTGSAGDVLPSLLAACQARGG